MKNYIDNSLQMRFKIILIFIFGFLLCESITNKAIGNEINIPQEDLGISEKDSRIIKNIEIKFVNEDGLTKDKKGQLITGRTQKDFIIDNLRLKTGDRFSEKLLKTDLRRLRKFESFDRVKVSLQEDETGVKITFFIKESSTPSWVFGGGNSGDIGIYGQVGYRDVNINGLNNKLKTELQVSGKDIQFNGEFTKRYNLGKPNHLGYRIAAFRQRNFSETFSDDIRLQDGSTAREGRFGASVALLRSFNDWDGALGLNYRRISLRNSDYQVARVDSSNSPLSVSGTGIDDLVTLSLQVTQDKRDRRDYPTQGSILSLSTEQAIPIGLGKIKSNRLRANYIHYLPVKFLGGHGSSKNTEMLAVNLQTGTIIGTFSPADSFNLGGLNSVRGYDNGKVASARSYGLASVEYRFPILRSVGGIVFTDFATDFGSSGSVLGEPGVKRGKPGSGFGYGVGLRVLSPFGLLRGDLGINDEGDVRFEVTTGQRF